MHFPFRKRIGSVAAVLAVSGAALVVSPLASAGAQPPTTHQMLVNAARTESAAYLQYYGYANAADRTHQLKLANDWRIVARVEHQDHWTHEETLGSFYSGTDNVANLKTAISQANETASLDRGWAARNPTSRAAQVLKTVAARETGDARLLSQALTALQTHGTFPNAPSVTRARETVSMQPKYSGTFYNDLTGAMNSGLEQAAWLWAEYQYIAKTAVDTGHADVARLLSGLQDQERYQNWVEISNAAGYVNGTVTNLENSVAGEQGAIDMYTQYANQANKDGKPSSAKVFKSIRGDEVGHRHTFSIELRQATHG